MSKQLKAVDSEGRVLEVSLDRPPDECPICKKGGQPDFQVAAFNRSARRVHAVYRCPRTDCRGLYLAVYNSEPNSQSFIGKLTGTAFARYIQTPEFQKNISTLSPDFCEIYSQSLMAEENGLDQICGPGYRKALEFLVKDFLIKHSLKDDAEKQEQVKKQFLGNVIKNLVDEPRIKQCAERAVWLGNDETHYLRKWTGHEVGDLKSLISMTASHIDLVMEAERYKAEMPAPK